MEAPTPKFTHSFHVWTDKYGDFIGKKVRPDVTKYCSWSPNVDQPVLPPEKKIPEHWFHIILYTATSSLTLAIRMDNLYLVGFMTSTGAWWEFNNEDRTHLISEATWLGFGGSYLDLIPKNRLEDIKLGRAQMSYAVDALAKYPTEMILEEEKEEEEEDPYAKPKSALVKLVIMLCEGMRFLTVSGTVDKGFGKEVKIKPIEATHVNNWDKISKAVLKDDFSDVKKIGIKDKDDADRIIALLKDQTSTDENKNEL